MIYEYVIISSFRMADFDRHCDHKQPLFAAKKSPITVTDTPKYTIIRMTPGEILNT